MKVGWTLCRLDDVKAQIPNSIVGGPFGSNLVNNDYRPDGIPVIRGHNLSNGTTRFDASDFVFVDEQKARELSANIAVSGDVIFTQRGTLGQVGIVPDDLPYKRFVISQSQMKLTCDRNKADPIFIYYYFRSPEILEYIRSHAISTGVPHTNLAILKATPLLLPPLSVQRRIASVLGALDDKIECNRRMNQTLEAMAQTLYKHWFVDSDRPEFCPITEFVEADPPVPIPRNRAVPFVEMKALPVWSMSVTDVASRRFAGGAKFKNGDTLLAAITPSLENGKTAFVDFLEADEAGFGSTEFIVLRPKQGISPQFVYCSARDESLRQRAIKSMVGSSGRQRVRRDFLDGFEIKAFSEQTMSEFHERTLPWFKQIRANVKENQTLARTRDYLLPKLLSGEVEVKAAEKQIAETP